MQAIGRAWEESLLLRLAVNAEEVVERMKLRVWYGVLRGRGYTMTMKNDH